MCWVCVLVFVLVHVLGYVYLEANVLCVVCFGVCVLGMFVLGYVYMYVKMCVHWNVRWWW